MGTEQDKRTETQKHSEALCLLENVAWELKEIQQDCEALGLTKTANNLQYILKRILVSKKWSQEAFDELFDRWLSNVGNSSNMLVKSILDGHLSVNEQK